MSIEVNSILKLHALIAIAHGPVHGYELLQALAQRTGKAVSPSQVYPFLSELHDGGFVIIKEEGARDKKSYSLTKEGKKLLDTLLRRCNDLVDLAIKNQLKPCHHCGAEIYRGDYTKKINGITRHFCCPHCAAAYGKTPTTGCCH